MSYKACPICCKPIRKSDKCIGCSATERYLNWWFALDEIQIMNRLKEKAAFDMKEAYDAGLHTIHRIAVGEGISIPEAAVKYVNILRREMGF